MSKMTKPEVDVVKFHESDVIVASVDVLRVSGFGTDGQTRNGIMSFNRQEAKYDKKTGEVFPRDFYDFVTDGRGAAIKSPTFGETTLDNLFEADWSSEDLTPTYDLAHADDGRYLWNGSTSMWEYRGQ